jgi:hypothetical protein
MTPLMANVLGQCNHEVVQLLVSAGASVTLATHKGKTLQDIINRAAASRSSGVDSHAVHNWITSALANPLRALLLKKEGEKRHLTAALTSHRRHIQTLEAEAAAAARQREALVDFCFCFLFLFFLLYSARFSECRIPEISNETKD